MKKKLIKELIKTEALEKLISELSEKGNFEVLGWLSRMLQNLMMPFVDIFEKNGYIHVVADLPGFKAEDIDIIAKEDEKKIIISGNRQKETFDLIEDGRATEFERTIHLPAKIDGKGTAELEEGILEIKLNKKSSHESQIEVK
ncbi:MAG: Molecular chaperone HSP20 family, IbpA [Candidatus Methanohalarchaeum thermophilum]|uniref:Molecular chaperone HSP20 family, IbpA n=1 Tax=Methanohalarchaeum thermophilum TaxID=1903181 RepID=A0A1Q6DUA1_METT1|nr:MAG: Molecular chaperone HSP20 family, IbpA [Candidatus Methanohalarchaeum thermophilum]